MSAKLLLTVLMSMATGVLLMAYGLSNKKISYNMTIILFVTGVAFIVTAIMFAITLVLASML